jgi:hypothetical protein
MRGRPLPPYPVSASATNGTVGSMLAIIAAWSLISFIVATPRSAMPSRDIVVPAPVLVDQIQIHVIREDEH